MSEARAPEGRAVVGDRLCDELVEEARRLGFSMVGVAAPEASEHLPFYQAWIERGLHGEMEYLAREASIRRRRDLSETMESVRSVLVAAHEYYVEDSPQVTADASVGIIARYARGADYHRVVDGKLRTLARWLDGRVEGGVEARAYVDTGPILERDLGRRAGLGWFGRNTMLIHPRRGSFFFLGVLLLDVELPPSDPFVTDHCGSCHACIDACPTGALLGRDEDGAPVIDARRCISYLTIELRGSIPLELRPLMGNRVYGCDICQEVCPFNVRFAEETTEHRYAARGPGELPYEVESLPGERAVEMDVPADGRDAGARADGGATPAEGKTARAEARPATTEDGTAPQPVSGETGFGGTPPHPGTDAPSLVELMRMTREEWDTFSRGSAIRRAGYAGFKRNVAVAIGNWMGSVDEVPEDAVAVLREAAEEESDLVREHAKWALGRAARGPCG